MKFFYGSEADMFTFFKIPKLLFSPPYKHISTDAKLLYGLMLDRMGLSAKSERWIDPDGRVFIYFPIAEVMELLNISDKPATRLFKELESVELIQRKRQGLGKPTKIYVSKFFKNAEEPPDREQNRKDTVSRIGEFPIQETANFRMPPFKKTESLDTENQSDQSISEAATTPTHTVEETHTVEGVEQLESQVRSQISYDTLLANRPWNRDAAANIVHLIADTCASKKRTIRINGEIHAADEVRRRLLALNYEDIEAVLDTIYNPDAQTIHGKIKNMRAYLLTALYNAPGTSAAYTTNAGLYGDLP